MENYIEEFKYTIHLGFVLLFVYLLRKISGKGPIDVLLGIIRELGQLSNISITPSMINIISIVLLFLLAVLWNGPALIERVLFKAAAKQVGVNVSDAVVFGSNWFAAFLMLYSLALFSVWFIGKEK